MPKVRSNGLYERMCLLETGIYSVFWNDILDRVNATSRKLQDPNLGLNAAVAMVVSLKRFVEAKRETFTEYERHGATLSGTSDYVQTRQRPRNVRFDYGPVSDAKLTPSQKFRVTSYIPVIDQFVVSLAHRLSAFEELCSRFGFLGKLDSLKPGVHTRSARQETRSRVTNDCISPQSAHISADSPGESGVASHKVSANHYRCHY